MPQAEEILADRWALVEKIDEGAMGEIYAARHAVLGHAVAVKVLIPAVSRDKAATERFLREARIAARLQHRNVVRVEDFGVAADGRPFLVMELLRGESLARRLGRAPALTPAESLDIVRQIAAAVDAAHAAGIVHRDLKPENVFLAVEHGAPVVKVLDFGVAKFTDTLANAGHATASNTLVGTPRYMSPEQARSLRELDGRSDLWSLGMIAYEMITGSHPFEGEAIAELLVAILTHRIPPPTSRRAGLPSALDAWAERALARSRYERFSTGRELADALADALDGRVDERWALDTGDTYRRGGRARRSTPLMDAPRARRATPLMDVAAPRRTSSPELDAPREKRPPPEPEAPPPPSPSKLTPLEGPAPVTVSKTPDETGPRAAPSTGSGDTAPRAWHPSRASWSMAAVVALIAGLGLVFAIRSAGVSRNIVRPAAQHGAAAVMQEFSRPPDPPASGDRVAPVEPPLPAAVPAAREAMPEVAPEPRHEPREGRRRHRSRHHERHEEHPDSGAQHPHPEGGGLYDPPGI